MKECLTLMCMIHEMIMKSVQQCRTYTENGFYCVVINIKIKTYVY